MLLSSLSSSGCLHARSSMRRLNGLRLRTPFAAAKGRRDAPYEPPRTGWTVLDGSCAIFGKAPYADIQTAFRTIAGVHFLESIQGTAHIVQLFHRIELQQSLQRLSIGPEPVRDLSMWLAGCRAQLSAIGNVACSIAGRSFRRMREPSIIRPPRVLRALVRSSS